jgi:predicted DNA repair protein MutK
MAAGSLFALLDDIATMLDDVSVMTKVAAKKTAGVLGDDLALNAQQVSGVDASRELPVVWAVAKGSFINKLILVPAALTISYFAPWVITPLLMIGGAFLCFEGAEKLVHKLLHSKNEDNQHEKELAQAVADPNVDLVALEKDKIKGAIRTDFILSAEIIVIALGSVAGVTATFSKQVAVVSTIAIIMTVGVYGLVAGIVKLDDLGLHLMLKKGASFYRQLQRKLGAGLLAFAPKLMRFLSVAGTAAMFMVGGSIIGHGVPALHHFSEHIAEVMHDFPVVGGFLAAISPIIIDAIIGLIVGVICVVLFEIVTKLMPKKRQPKITH